MTPRLRASRDWLAGTGLALGALVALGWLPTRRLAGAAGLAAMGAGVAVSWVGAALAALPVLAAVARGGSERPVAVVGQAMALRAGATVVGALVAILGSELPRTALAVWIGLAYAALLAVETRWMTRWMTARAAGPEDGGR
jgi:hypothetical protein